jgi:hypothetical protein
MGNDGGEYPPTVLVEVSRSVDVQQKGQDGSSDANSFVKASTVALRSVCAGLGLPASGVFAEF